MHDAVMLKNFAPRDFEHRIVTLTKAARLKDKYFKLQQSGYSQKTPSLLD
jgi:hypothetical protein